MLVTLGWMLLAGLSPTRSAAMAAGSGLVRPPVVHQPAAGRVSVWTDRDEPYARGDGARVFLSVDAPSYLAVFRVDTDGRIRVILPVDPWSDSYLRDERELEISGRRGGGRAFVVDDDPGVGYLFAIAAAEPLDFRAITRGDYWDYRLIDGGRIQGDPYVALTDLAARLVPDGDYDYDVAPYYVDRRYDYPRFVCYDCHAAASYSEWNPYRTSCTRYRVVIRDDPRYYPYRYGGRNVVADRPAHPGPRYVFRDADPRRPAVTHGEPERRRGDDAGDPGRTSEDIGGRGAVPAPTVRSLRQRDRGVAPERSPARSVLEARRRAERRGEDQAGEAPRQERDDSAQAAPEGLRPSTATPHSTGEPELRRRRRPVR